MGILSCCLSSYSLLPTITVDGLIYSHIKVGGYNGAEFLEYLFGLTAQMNLYPAPCSVLVIDNCRIHHVFGVEELCATQYVPSLLKLLSALIVSCCCSGIK